MRDRTTLKIKNQVEQEHDHSIWWRCLCGLIVGIFVVGGFAFAAQQHFAAIENSAKNVELQRQREKLKNERQRLLLEREAALSPSHLEKLARNIGLQNVSFRQIDRVTDFIAQNDEEKIVMPEIEKPKNQKQSTEQQSVEKTEKNKTGDSKSQKK